MKDYKPFSKQWAKITPQKWKTTTNIRKHLGIVMLLLCFAGEQMNQLNERLQHS